MPLLHIQLFLRPDQRVELRYFTQNPNQFESRWLDLGEIAELLKRADTDYYTRHPENFAQTGRKLFDWLDGSDRWLKQHLPQNAKGAVAIETAGNLAHLPWEVLCDDSGFLVQRGVIPVRWRKLAVSGAKEPANRPLQMLFMATSPESSRELDYEQEEARILAATQRQPLLLEVEESGCLGELRQSLADFGRDQFGNYFDVVHLTGHGLFRSEAGRAELAPCFVTESELGEACYSRGADIAAALGEHAPQLLFLSGCHTGERPKGGAGSGAGLSLAEELLETGAAVLGWGRPVRDGEATAAAAKLYQSLAEGGSLIAALTQTYQMLIKEQARDWHLLRLFVAGMETAAVPEALVTSGLTRGRQLQRRREASEFYLDARQQVKVVGRQGFVGRRRILQRCLRAMQDESLVGVWLHGMGGLGKSAVAARLCDRLAMRLKSVVWVGELDQPVLVSRLAELLETEQQRRALLSREEGLKFRLKRALEELLEQDQRLLLVWDDFEQNMQPGGQDFRLKDGAAGLLKDLVWALRETGFHRLLVTSRYRVAFSEERAFYWQPFEAFSTVEMEKKCQRLTGFLHPEAPPQRDAAEAVKQDWQVKHQLQVAALTLADGNPRLMEKLERRLDESESAAAQLEQLTENPEPLRQEALNAELLACMDAELQPVLAKAAIFRLPVPQPLLIEFCATAAQLERAVALGLLEVSGSPQTPDLRVPQILPLPTDWTKATYQQAAELLYRYWWQEAETSTEPQRLELHRLAMAAGLGEMAATLGVVLTIGWIKRSRFRDAEALCRQTLELVEDFRLIHNLAMAERQLGKTQAALQNYQQALDDCPERNDDETLKERSAIIHNTAELLTQQGQVDRALGLYQQSLEAEESIGDVRGKAATLHQMAGIYAQQGQVDRALGLYQQFAEIDESIGDVQGKAAT
ncbi:MAG: CHAT domain-containing protein, partial [Pegethrix bostrychoides GSE-TBD4-15B]|nr:CHAT domain-containing protein [Pegethrix bostrychoides GSE-TBD4-15B]